MFAHVLLVLAAAPATTDFKRLHAEQATATSFLESNWNKYQENYHPNYALDDDPKTAWVEGVDGEGVGESLSVRLSTLKSARALRLVIASGYQKSKQLFAANGMPTELKVQVRGPAGQLSGEATLTLLPKWGAQSFDVPLSAGLAEVTLTVNGVRSGTVYKDTCLSDVQFFVDSDVPYDPRVEQARRKALLDWKKERLATAKYFAARPPTYPFASARYEGKDVATQSSAHKASDATQGAAELEKRIAAGTWDFEPEEVALVKEARAPKRAGRWYSVAAKQAPRLPDGLSEVLPGVLAALVRPAEAALFEAKKQEPAMGVLRAVKPDAPEDRRAALSNVLLLEGTLAEPKKLLALVRDVTIDRADYETTSTVVMTFEQGLLRRLVVWGEEAEVSGGTRNLEEGSPPEPEVRHVLRAFAQAWRFEVTKSRIHGVQLRQVEATLDAPFDDEPNKTVTFTSRQYTPRAGQ